MAERPTPNTSWVPLWSLILQKGEFPITTLRPIAAKRYQRDALDLPRPVQRLDV